jgi:putative acetyltransferase
MRVPAPIGPYSFRELLIVDYARVIELWRHCEGVGLNESDTPDGIARFLERNPGLSLVVETTDHQLVAAVLCGQDGRRGYLHHLAVAAPHRRHGLGRQLVETCLENLRGLGIAKCNIFLYADNNTGRAFWLRRGWAAREDLVVVQKALTPGTE